MSDSTIKEIKDNIETLIKHYQTYTITDKEQIAYLKGKIDGLEKALKIFKE